MHNTLLPPSPQQQVYLPMSYMYGLKATGKLTPLVMDLRQELYTQDYATVNWNAARNQVAPEDMYYPHPRIQDALWWSLYQVERAGGGEGGGCVGWMDG